MGRKQQQPPEHFWAPRWWPVWVGVGLGRLLARLPFGLLMGLGTLFGHLLFCLLPSRRHIVRVNLRLCFPELAEAEREALVRRVFVANGIGFFESLLAWWGPRQAMARRVRFEGLEHLEGALAEGRGVLLLGAHFSTLELGGLFMAEVATVNAMYRRHDNPLLDRIITQARQRFCPQPIERRDIRGVIRTLKKNQCVWYAPDQDLGKHASVFAPFFGQQAATLTATSRMARLNNSPVLMLAHYRNPDNRSYTVRLSPPLEDFPSGDDVADAVRVNQVIEEAIRVHPEQYLWLHKRFKTQPDGRHKLYKEFE
ncbi:LpxL/LpxP family Kdo(2)-lipid IV(A) lauroyl/palmitoleoyl acyltransferase [Motiliproteus sp. SC1-56]|uniref:LpxL/LpxP family Kdo(2)-lipid IV(A) lauroyl/palmitoleoyl acyltransferase n=1 Tax=Motiliproteus sp. SC1-56 TaxID=2799565 RepID=UPI001A8F9FE7|nr:LpxL/LpxP family Kdo(2)-lipid IV(A) lauroyl/palmitoleoyl acyltransferase [Motiliproteus sp. SC1-56]